MLELLPTLRAGIMDSFNPGSMATFFVFLVWVIFLAFKRLPLALGGISFVLFVFAVRFLFALGMLPLFFLGKYADVFLDVSYFVFASFSFLGGVYFWRRWAILRKVELAGTGVVQENGAISVGGVAGKVKKVFFWRDILLVLLGGAIFGGLLSLMSTAWAVDQYMAVVLSQYGGGNNFGFVLRLILIYSTAFVFILFFPLLTVGLALKSTRFVSWLQRSSPLISIISAAVFLAYGLAFFSYYIPLD